jgi:hypothetical protein
MRPNQRETEMTQNWQFKVVKSMRGMNGKWFAFPIAATFETEVEARRYAEEFVAEQRASGVAGARINVFSRRKIPGLNSIAEYRV